MGKSLQEDIVEMYMQAKKNVDSNNAGLTDQVFVAMYEMNRDNMKEVATLQGVVDDQRKRLAAQAHTIQILETKKAIEDGTYQRDSLFH